MSNIFAVVLVFVLNLTSVVYAADNERKFDTDTGAKTWHSVMKEQVTADEKEHFWVGIFEIFPRKGESPFST